MTFNSTNLLLEDLVPEPGLELSLTQRRRRYVHGFLAATKEDLATPAKNGCTFRATLTDDHQSNTHVRHLRCDSGAIQRRLRRKRLQDLQGLRFMYLG